MIIAHFFLRNVKKEPRLFVETTSSNGLEQPAPAAINLMPVKLTDDRKKWIRDAYYEFTKRFPDLVLKDSMDNYLRLESSHPAFDMVFKPKRLVKRKSAPKKHEDNEDIEDSEDTNTGT